MKTRVRILFLLLVLPVFMVLGQEQNVLYSEIQHAKSVNLDFKNVSSALKAVDKDKNTLANQYGRNFCKFFYGQCYNFKIEVESRVRHYKSSSAGIMIKIKKQCNIFNRICILMETGNFN